MWLVFLLLQHPDCHGFGGKIHGESTCARWELATGKVSRIEKRVWRDATVTMKCGRETKLRAGVLRVVCFERPLQRNRLLVDVTASLGKRVVKLDTHEGFWDYVNLWIAEREGAIDFTIDYVVLD